jgi:uncharacterized membrane protein
MSQARRLENKLDEGIFSKIPVPSREKLCSMVGLAVFAIGVSYMVGAYSLLESLLAFARDNLAPVTISLAAAGITFCAYRTGRVLQLAAGLLAVACVGFWYYFPAFVLGEDGTTFSVVGIALAEIGIALICICQYLKRGYETNDQVFCLFSGLNTVLCMVAFFYALMMGVSIESPRRVAESQFTTNLIKEGVEIDERAQDRVGTISVSGERYSCSIQNRKFRNYNNSFRAHCIPIRD